MRRLACRWRALLGAKSSYVRRLTNIEELLKITQTYIDTFNRTVGSLAVVKLSLFAGMDPRVYNAIITDAGGGDAVTLYDLCINRDRLSNIEAVVTEIVQSKPSVVLVVDAISNRVDEVNQNLRHLSEIRTELEFLRACATKMLNNACTATAQRQKNGPKLDCYVVRDADRLTELRTPSSAVNRSESELTRLQLGLAVVLKRRGDRTGAMFFIGDDFNPRKDSTIRNTRDDILFGESRGCLYAVGERADDTGQWNRSTPSAKSAFDTGIHKVYADFLAGAVAGSSESGGTAGFACASSRTTLLRSRGSAFAWWIDQDRVVEDMFSGKRGVDSVIQLPTFVDLMVFLQSKRTLGDGRVQRFTSAFDAANNEHFPKRRLEVFEEMIDIAQETNWKFEQLGRRGVQLSHVRALDVQASLAEVGGSAPYSKDDVKTRASRQALEFAASNKSVLDEKVSPPFDAFKVEESSDIGDYLDAAVRPKVEAVQLMVRAFMSDIKSDDWRRWVGMLQNGSRLSWKEYSLVATFIGADVDESYDDGAGDGGADGGADDEDGDGDEDGGGGGGDGGGGGRRRQRGAAQAAPAAQVAPAAQAPRNENRTLSVECRTPVQPGDYEILITDVTGDCFYDSVAKVMQDGSTMQMMRERTADFFLDAFEAAGNYSDATLAMLMQKSETIVFSLMRELLDSPDTHQELIDVQPMLLTIANQNEHARDINTFRQLYAAAIRTPGLVWASMPDIEALGTLLGVQICVYRESGGGGGQLDLHRPTLGVEGGRIVTILWENWLNSNLQHFKGLRVFDPPPSGA